jgi:DNA repair protein RadA|tara:strand:- start:9008 stop:10105 length:1098 start_codon:yes stop_codon:yes gene_type:complete
MEAINVYDDKMVKKKEKILEDDVPSADLNDTAPETPDVETVEAEIDKPELDLSVSQLEGVGAITQKKLEAFGVANIIDICVRGSREVSEITSVSKATTDTWVFKAQKLLEDNDLIRKADMDVSELLDYHDQLPTLATQCVEVDNLMGGGVKPEATYEVYGEFGAGKTQFCNSLACEAIKDGGTVIWIDCEDTFKPRRIIQMLVAREEITEEEAKEKLNNITYLYCPNTEQLLGTINSLSPILLEKKPKLVVLDGAIGQFREEYLGRGTLADRQMQIARLMTHIKNISFYFRCPVVFTNQVQSDPAMMFGDPIKPIGGNVVAHASTYRIYFKKSGKKRLARMVDSPEHAQADAEYILTVKGIVNTE